MMISPAVESTCVTAAALKSVISNAFRMGKRGISCTSTVIPFELDSYLSRRALLSARPWPEMQKLGLMLKTENFYTTQPFPSCSI
jgi:hypothetical protein